MDKKIKFLFIVGGIVFLIVILCINILIKKYSDESQTLPSEIKESVLEKEIPASTQVQDIEREPPIEEGPLLN